ncbi:MAG: insulinase family protein [Bdellovibrionales bacterium]|nr:insulinase family protein [Bdellovibrionales bacterium]
MIYSFLLFAGIQSVQAMPVEFEKDSNLPLVHISVVLKTGSVSDPKGQYGITNFLGELMARGTKTRTKHQIDLEMDQMGAQFDVETRAEMMIFRGSVLAREKKKFLNLVREILTDPSFPEAESRKLKKEIVTSILENLGRDQGLANQRFSEVLFSGHEFSKPILGRKKDIEDLTQEQLKKHYSKWFHDQNLFITGSGDAGQGEIRDFADQLTAGLKDNIADKATAGIPAPKHLSKKRFVIIDKPDRTQVQIQAGQVGIRFDDPRYFKLYLANHAFGGGGFTSRLMQEIRVKRGWSYGAASHFRFGTQPRSWQYGLFPKSDYAVEALKKTFDMVQSLKDNGITEAEFEFSKSSSINSAGFSFNTPQKRSENRILEIAFGLPKGFMERTAAELKNLSLSEVNSAVKDFLQPDQMAVVIVGTAKDLVPAMTEKLGISEKDIEVFPYTKEL